MIVILWRCLLSRQQFSYFLPLLPGYTGAANVLYLFFKNLVLFPSSHCIVATSSYVLKTHPKVPFCPWSQMSQSSRFLSYQVFSEPPGKPVWRIAGHCSLSRTSFALHSITAIMCLLQSISVTCSSSTEVFIMYEISTSISNCGLFCIYYINHIWQSIIMSYITGFTPYLFCFYCTVYTLKTTISIFEFLPPMKSFNSFKINLFHCSESKNILQTEFVWSFANSFFEG